MLQTEPRVGEPGSPAGGLGDRSDMARVKLEGLPCAVLVDVPDDVIHSYCDDGPRNADGITVSCCGEAVPEGASLAEVETPHPRECALCAMFPEGKCACWDVASEVAA